jgi:hypothetical protein
MVTLNATSARICADTYKTTAWQRWQRWKRWQRWQRSRFWLANAPSLRNMGTMRSKVHRLVAHRNSISRYGHMQARVAFKQGIAVDTDFRYWHARHLKNATVQNGAA